MVVTVSSQYGSKGLGAARGAAELLRYKFVDRQLPVVVSKRLGISREAVDAAETVGTSVGERMLQALGMGTPEVIAPQEGQTFDEECAREVRRVVLEYAARGNCVIVGRGGSAILGRRHDVLRVFLHAPRAWRIHQIMDGHAVDEKTATAEVDRIDRARRAYMRRLFDLEWGDAAEYDLSIDTAAFDGGHTEALIARAVEVRG